MGWVPAVPFDLTRYYESEYGRTKSKDRRIAPEIYFGAAPPSGTERYFRRARSQIRQAREHLESLDSVLDFGSGPGYALHESGAVVKHAVEHDENSLKYLNYLGAELQTIDALPSDFYDLVISSHSLEHLLADDIYPTLAKLRRAIRPGGVLLIEVPGGGLARYRMVSRHEPHTLFFTPESLRRILERAGFEIEHAETLAKKTNPTLVEPLYAPKDESDGFINSSRGGIRIIGRRPASGTEPQPRPEVASIAGAVVGDIDRD